MTLDELADLTADKLKALSNKELEDILRPYFNVTRPEQIVRVQTQKKEDFLDPKQREVMALLAADGFDMSLLKNRRKKK